MKRALFLLAAPLLLSVVAGCSRSSDDPGTAEAAATTPVAAPVWVAPSATSAGPGGGAAATSGPPAPSARKGTGGKANPRPTKTTTVTMDDPVASATRCRTKDLRASLGTARTVGGSVYQTVVLTNRSGHRCALAGYPGVRWVDAAGKQVNDAFGDVPRETPSEVVIVRSGSSAHATLIFPKPGTTAEAQCLTVKVTAYRITPPGESTPITVPHAGQACSANGVDAGRVQAIEAGKS